MIVDVDDDVDEVPHTDFAKAAARVFDKIDNVKDGVLPSSRFIDLIGALGGNATEDKTNISARMLYRSSKNVISCSYLAAITPPEIRGGGFATYYSIS